MTDVDPVTWPGSAGPGTEDDERTAELVLTRLADARVLMAMRPAAKILAIVAAVLLTVAGVWLRGHAGQPPGRSPVGPGRPGA